MAFLSTSKFKSSLNLLCNTDMKLTYKICRAVAMQLIEDKPLSDILPEEKQNQLIETYEIDNAKFSSLQGFLIFIFRQAIFHGMKPVSLSAHLQESEVPEEIAELICKVYTEAAPEINDRLREWSLNAHPGVTDVEWQTGVGLSSSLCEKSMESTCMLTMYTDDGKQQTFAVGVDELRSLKTKLDIAARQLGRVVKG
ncbi:HCaRG [Carpediemonas membranifera]|uniref:HCaRG n=1 Tax=Carpediemonas membranifera TaxID=201153 RepID=A0A8J6E4U6_9EUKA|nr:HCaRG [Carpediemonas membranifera]|eukprot:KAG9394957.1 HCaRG [Carpediemonas membranifera]